MISIDREMLWQWDRGQRVQLHDVSVGTAVHFSNAAIKPNALVTEAYEDGEGVYANIPNILLQTAGTLTAYIYIEDGDEGHTEYRKLFIVRDREKPDDYVYTEDDVKTWVSLEERIKVLEESGGGAAGGLIRPLSEIGEIDGVTVEHVPDKDRVDLTVEMTADNMDSVFGGNAVYKNDYLNARQLQLMFRIPGAGRLFLWELFEDDLVTVTNYPNKKFIMVSTNRMIFSFTYDDNGQFVSETKTYQANVQQVEEVKATIPNSATINNVNELVMQRTDGDAVSELFKVALPQGGGGADETWELINDYTVENNVNYIIVNKDSDGKMFALKKILVFVDMVLNRTDDKTIGTYESVSGSAEISGHKVFPGSTAFAVGSPSRTVRYYGELVAGYFHGYRREVANSGTVPVIFDMSTNTPYIPDGINAFGLFPSGWGVVQVSAGTKIKIYGVRM